MSQPDSDRSSSDSSRRILSALADGDATAGEAAQAFQAWRDDPEARAAWHVYQLIGDVLRSDDLATAPEADAAFLAALRARLADEPVVLAPQPRASAPAVPAAAAAVRTRGRWQGPLAMAAGFLVVMSGLSILRPLNQGASPQLASNGAAASGPQMASITSTNNGGADAAPTATPVSTKAAADQLAPYLAAHRQSAMNAPFQMPGGDLRNVSLVQPAR